MSTWQETEFGKIPIKWNYLRIENTDLQIGDGNYSSKYPRASELLSEGIPFISSTDLINGKISADNLRYISADHHSRLLKGHIKQGDVLIVVRGNGVGQVGLVSKEYDDANLNAQMAYLGRSNRIDGAFLYYLLSKYYSDGVTETVVSGSAQPQITVSGLKQLSLIVPPLPEQKAIASVLSSLDDKIDLIHRQNKTLEAMAETLFRQWFVEEAQEDWEVTTIGAALDTVLGGTPSTTKLEYWGGDIPWINSGEVNKFRIVEATKFITEIGLKKSNTKLLPKGTTVVAITGATLGQVSLLEINTCANQSVVGIIPNKRVPKEFVFLWVKLKIREIVLSETGGAQPHINKNDINGTEIVIPPDAFLLEKMKPIEVWISKITANVFQIHTLEKLRDTLLPKLMSGEVRVDYEHQDH